MTVLKYLKDPHTHWKEGTSEIRQITAKLVLREPIAYYRRKGFTIRTKGISPIISALRQIDKNPPPKGRAKIPVCFLLYNKPIQISYAFATQERGNERTAGHIRQTSGIEANIIEKLNKLKNEGFGK